ncbi:putative beta-lysine N-acetyltransferase [Fictibacillus phosphorivorans]|uniref:putative beta-lysine N-acetyltransferase n=1 Tax=Fictibacillus phosphorivorans TaxID=1221500 RepID=UPI00203B8F5B|nr:putative beta-lysine N-acetyltransferase [Fictibacillus phosphorivorans]MCM3719611.1 putative beta-lysine N-acetyltransferase [Fictibacillus phosphorivorans]MCM3777315.1 putative beta-lysine N-acetyltransferase [Fictibacillus phosphorivorans]
MHTTFYKNDKIEQPNFTADVCLDFYNKRLRIDDYRGSVRLLSNWIDEIAAQNKFEKIIIKSRQEDLFRWLELGFVYEGEFTGYFNGASAVSMCKYLDNERRNSIYWTEEDKILKNVLKLAPSSLLNPLPKEYELRMADEQDSKELADLYNQVFEVYPTPMDDPEYVLKMIRSGTLFCVVTHQQKIISAASADVNADYHNAEITDCATLPEHRKFGLMKHLVSRLEQELFKKKIYCSYSIARALSFGMNAVFHQKGYVYKGRLANNCKIFDKFEDMNIWVKDLSETK